MPTKTLNVEMDQLLKPGKTKSEKTDNSLIKFFIGGTSCLMGIAEAAAPANSCIDSFKLLFSDFSLSASDAFSYVSAAFVFAAALYLTYVLFTDSMKKTKDKLPEITSDYKLVMYTFLYLFTFRWSEIFELKTKKDKKLQDTRTAIPAFFIALLTVLSTLLAIASAIACAALAANSLIGIWSITPVIVFAMIAFVAEIIATTCLNNVYFVQTLDTAITARPKTGWFIWYIEEISGKDHNDDSDNAHRWKKAPIAFFIKCILFLGLSACVSIIVPYIFYSQLIELNSQLNATVNPLLNKLGLPAIPHLSITTIYAILFSAVLVLVVFRIRALWMAADKIYGLIVKKYFNDGKQNTKNKTISPKIKKKLRIGFILALINGAFYGCLSFGAKDSLPDFLTHNKYVCFGFLVGACFALGASSMSANFDSWENYYNPSPEEQSKTYSKTMSDLFSNAEKPAQLSKDENKFSDSRFCLCKT